MPNSTYRGTNTVKNLLGARTHDAPEIAEAGFVVARAYEIPNRFGPKGEFDAAH